VKPNITIKGQAVPNYRKRKSEKIGKEAVKISLFADDMILHLKTQKVYSKAPRHHQ
jgi:hypothetical protein